MSDGVAREMAQDGHTHCQQPRVVLADEEQQAGQ